jgi:hypothetical protein
VIAVRLTPPLTSVAACCVWHYQAVGELLVEVTVPDQRSCGSAAGLLLLFVQVLQLLSMAGVCLPLGCMTDAMYHQTCTTRCLWSPVAAG